MVLGATTALGISDNYEVVHFIGDGFRVVPPFNKRTGTNPSETCATPCEVVDTEIPRLVRPPEFNPDAVCNILPPGFAPEG